MGKNGISVLEKKYINQKESLAVVSFQLPYLDWCVLQKSEQWVHFENLLLETQRKHTETTYYGEK